MGVREPFRPRPVIEAVSPASASVIDSRDSGPGRGPRDVLGNGPGEESRDSARVG